MVDTVVVGSWVSVHEGWDSLSSSFSRRALCGCSSTGHAGTGRNGCHRCRRDAWNGLAVGNSPHALTSMISRATSLDHMPQNQLGDGLATDIDNHVEPAPTIEWEICSWS